MRPRRRLRKDGWRKYYNEEPATPHRQDRVHQKVLEHQVAAARVCWLYGVRSLGGGASARSEKRTSEPPTISVPHRKPSASLQPGNPRVDFTHRASLRLRSSGRDVWPTPHMVPTMTAQNSFAISH